MSAEVPMVATRVGGIPEMLTHNETAILVPPRAPHAFAAGLARVLKAPEIGRRCSDAARKAVETRFSTDMYVNSLLRIYREVLQTDVLTRIRT
jgi:glycosyltransferase involved in cell wall biosynthesis